MCGIFRFVHEKNKVTNSMIRDVHVVNDFFSVYNQKMSYVKTFYHPKYETSKVT